MQIRKRSETCLVKRIAKIIAFKDKGLERCDALRDLIPFVPFKKCEKHSRRSFNFSKIGQMVPNCATHHRYAFPKVVLVITFTWFDLLWESVSRFSD